MDETKKFLDPQTLKITNYVSSNTDEMFFTNTELGYMLGLNTGFIEYVTSSFFTDLTAQGDYEMVYMKHLYKHEASAVLQIAEAQLKKLKPIFLNKLKGKHIVFSDANPFLADENIYGKLIMKIVNEGNIPYIDHDAAVYDIYIAGTALQQLYLTHIGVAISEYLNNPRFSRCYTYYDVYAAVMMTDPSLRPEFIAKTVFIDRYNKGQFPWIKREFERADNIGFLHRIFNLVEPELQHRYLKHYLITKFKGFVQEVVDKCPKELISVYTAEMDRMFASAGDELFMLAKRYNDIKEGKVSDIDVLIKDIVKIDFVPMTVVIDNKIPVIVVNRYSTEYPFLAFDSRLTNIGTLAYINMINNLGFVAVSIDYINLINEYNLAVKGYMRNKYANTILALAKLMVNDPALNHKKIIFNDPAPFFGNTYNFVGKAIECSFVENELLVNYRPQSPEYNPNSEYNAASDYNPQSPRYDPNSPLASRAPSPELAPEPVLAEPVLAEKSILLRMGQGAYFEYSENAVQLERWGDFSITPDPAIDFSISSWVEDRFTEFFRFYIYLYNEFIAPSTFDLEVFYRDVYSCCINSFADKAEVDKLTEMFHPNNSISKLFVSLIVSNLVVVGDLISPESVSKFTDYKNKGRQQLINDDNIFTKYTVARDKMVKKLTPYFERPADRLKTAHFILGVVRLGINLAEYPFNDKQVVRTNFFYKAK